MALDGARATKPIRKLRKLLKNMPAVPEAEDVHDFRTSSRRIEATFHALSLDSRRHGQQTLKQVSKLRKQAGKVRDMDVLTDYLSSVSSRGKERECLIRLLEHLGAQRLKYAKKFDSTRQQYAAKLNKRLKQTCRQIDKLLSSNGRTNVTRNEVSAEAAASALSLLTALAESPRLGAANLHQYRLRVKQLRNVLQMAKNSGRQEFVEKLRGVKNAIGEWHDWEELLLIAKRELNQRKPWRFLRRLKNVADVKFKKAVVLAEQMRTQLLRMPDRRKKLLPRQATFRPAEKVWLATAALVG